jgi:hypothetical protein
MIQPPFLKKGDKIGICATARWLTAEQWEPARMVLESWGLIPVVMPQVFFQNGQLAGTDQERTEGLMHCLLDPEIKAVLIARGGYGSVRVVDAIPDEVIIKQQVVVWVQRCNRVTQPLEQFGRILNTLYHADFISILHTDGIVTIERCIDGTLGK